MDGTWLRRAGIVVLALLIGLGAAYGWRRARSEGPGAGFIGGNGRIEAVEVDVATRQPGRIADILVDEGDLVAAGQVVARMDLHT